ncbi:hypothetical protein ABZQ16_21430 [Pseudomonas paraeruginosa]|uniref:hypothetical protein n=1 Tax=Pseudomonas aeruginosa group TaxID=136841 RepID=UPI0010436F84|nr:MULTISPECIES: hypothetical protein [Pseudomonas aeruginosa group]KAB0752104.1 hypothetical protein F7O94_02395 [Pseudomonas aeruginosa]MBG4069217.1 hypothetical protein [Pseudomonas aeruginosa]MBG5601497.1 hypothetical protein [Pseudomonas aeruginosa]MBH3674838.1 hypothetical protein [Pseudomonas aeruginosa]MBH9431351.1 hypothetical protein [Pseudomonas aeruginosa]
MKYPFSVLSLSLSLLPGSTPPAWIAARRFGSGSHLPASLGCPTERGSCTVGQRQWLQRRNGFGGVHECLERIDDFSRPRHRPLAVAAMGELQRAIGKAAQENPEFLPWKKPLRLFHSPLRPPSWSIATSTEAVDPLQAMTVRRAAVSGNAWHRGSLAA